MNFRISFDRIINLIWFSFILISPRQLSSDSNIQGYFLWNTGYSNFMTKVTPQRCRHIDPGGTLLFPEAIYTLCAGRQNIWAITEPDRFHKSYNNKMRSLGATEFKLKRHGAAKRLKPDQVTAKKKQEYFKEENFYIPNHLNKDSMNFLFNRKNRKDFSDYLVLPNHGQPKYLNQDIIRALSSFKMRIAGSQSRTYHHHLKTQKKFQKLNLPVVYKNIWGHLFFGI